MRARAAMTSPVTPAPKPDAAARRARGRLWRTGWVCGGVAVIAFLAFRYFVPLFHDELGARDRVVARLALQDDSVFVSIDEPSLRLDQLWEEDIEASPSLAAMAGSGFPWPRSVYADALDKLVGAGARLVVLDIILDSEGDPESDAALRTALDRHADRVVLASNISVDLNDPDNPDDDHATQAFPAESVLPGADGDDRIGFANFWPGPDDVIRAARYRTTLQGTLGKPELPGMPVYSSLAAAALDKLGESGGVPEDVSEIGFIRRGTTTTVPFYSIFLDEDWNGPRIAGGEIFRDRVVMIGPGAPRLQDFHLTPIGSLEGPLIHLSAIAAARQGKFFTTAHPMAALAACLFGGIVAFLLTTRIHSPLAALAGLAAAAAGWIAAVHGVAFASGWILPVLAPTATILAGGVICVGWNFAAERRETGRLRGTLERYVSRNVVREILDNRDDFLVALGGTRRPMTVLFSDVRGFTSYSENADAAAVVGQLNEYLGEMVRVIFARGGTVDKFMGDGILAIWGNVVSAGAEEDAASAVASALEMQFAVADLNARWEASGLPPFHVGIGLHHGDAVFGNIGSSEKMEPTVIGDAVNLASRIEGTTKLYGVPICVTEPVADLVGGRFHLRAVDKVRVVGRSRAVEISCPLGMATDDPPAWLGAHEAGIRAFREARFREAADRFREVDVAAPGDALAAIYLDRCKKMIAAPPPPDWDATWDMRSK